MTFLRFWRRWFVPVVLVAVPAYYFWLHKSDVPFRDSLMGNWFASLMGVIAGFPIALEINRRQQQAQDRQQHDLEVKETVSRKEKVLNLLKKELEYNRSALQNRQATDAKKRSVSIPGLKDELWKSFSASGELHWIDDPALLDILSTAYHLIKTTMHLEEHYFEAVHFAGMQVQQVKYPADRILEYLTTIDADALEHIDRAIRDIDEHLPPAGISS